MARPAIGSHAGRIRPTLSDPSGIATGGGDRESRCSSTGSAGCTAARPSDESSTSAAATGCSSSGLGQFGEVEGLEPDASLLLDPRWRSKIQVGTLGPGFRAEEPFDLVLLLDVLEHIEDDREALASAFEALKPGGHLLVTVPALPWLWSRHDEANEHHRRYLPRTLRRTLVDAGLSVVTLRYAFFWTVAPLLARRWLAPADPTLGVADYEVTIPPEPLNRVLTAFSRCEHAIGRVIRWPLGTSLLAVARRPDLERS